MGAIESIFIRYGDCNDRGEQGFWIKTSKINFVLIQDLANEELEAIRQGEYELIEPEMYKIKES